MSNISSNNILIFPAGRRQGEGNLNGTLISESRMSSLVNSLLDINGFVITNPGSNLGSISTLEMNILGRYFLINSSTNISNELGIINSLPTEDPQNNSKNYSAFLGISIASSTGGIIFDEIVGQDVNGNYSGVSVFCGNESEILTGDNSSNGDNTYNISGNTCVKIGVGYYDVTNSSSSWIIPYPEFSKIDYIDGGTID